MKSANLDIGIGDYRLKGASDVSITSSWEDLTDVASIEIARKLSFQGRDITQGENLFRRGDELTISMGYDGQLTERFSGYLMRIYPGVPLKFEAEDAFSLLKKGSITQSWRTTTLRGLLTDIIPGALPFDAADVNIGPFRMDRATPAMALEHLRQEYGVQSWCRNGKLYSGLAYRPELRAEHTFRFEYSILSGGNDLRWVDDAPIGATAISIRPDNTRIEVKVGDPAGQIRNLYFYDLSEADLKATAERELEKYSPKGYTGSFTIMGEPAVNHGDLVNLVDKRYADRNGAYLVKKVETRFGMGGMRQVITLDTNA